MNGDVLKQLRDGTCADGKTLKRGNLVLIGMPGCGKTAVSQRAARLLRVKRYDSDEVIEAKTGLTITEIFEKHGEEYFRELETQCLKELLKRKNTIIAAGGGAVLKNTGLLRENALVIYIERDIKGILSTLRGDKRPLLRENPEQRLSELLEERRSLYEGGCDVKITNDGSLSDVSKKVMGVYYAYFDY